MVYKIGDFSKKVDIPVRTLRYYDDFGLLKPSLVDKFTNYRYYSEDDVYDAEGIKLLKSLGFSLQEILNHKNSLYNDEIGEMAEILEQKQRQIEKEIENLGEKYDKIEILRKKIKGKILTIRR